MADETPSSPRPIGIKPITIKPIQPVAKPAVAPAAPAPAPAADAPKPIAPISIKPITPAASADAPKPVSPITITPTSAQGKPFQADAMAPTVRLKPVTPPAGSDAPAVTPIAPTIRPQTIQPPTIKPATTPPSAQAMKSKTSRISLDAALNDTSVATPVAKPVQEGKLTSQLSSEAILSAVQQKPEGSLPLQAGENDVTRRRTLRVKAPSAGTPVITPAGQNVAPEAAADAAPTVKKKTITLKGKSVASIKPTITPANADGSPAASANSDVPSFAEENTISARAAFQTQAPVKKTNPIFPILAIASVIMIITLSVLYMSQACGPDRSLTAFSTFETGPNVNWPGKIGSF